MSSTHCCVHLASLLVTAGLFTALPSSFAEPAGGITPKGKDGHALNLNFEDGTLKDWTATGDAFGKQPVKGDTVSARRGDMKSGHEGQYWIGTFEFAGDDAVGTLTSAPFKVTEPWASFLVGGGSKPTTRVELVERSGGKVIFKTSGLESEQMLPVVVDLKSVPGKEIFIRIVDEQKGGWGHINFDNFQLFSQRPVFANELNPARVALQNNVPPADKVLYAGLSPEEAAMKMSLPEGFKATLFAGEPDVKQPIAFALDDRGRVWVAEAYTYPKRAPEGEGKDRILVFEDTDGDGKFDKRTVFMEGLNLVSGLEVGFGGIWVGAAPYLMFIPVIDGPEPKPGGKPEILLDGWDYSRDTHETLNTFTWGPDGWLYGCHGVFCPSLVGKPGTPANQRQRVDAAVWRFHPTKRKFEVFSEGTSNPWGVDFDANGQIIIEACVIPHFWHMIQGGKYERQGGPHYSINALEMEEHKGFTGTGPNYVNPFVYDDIKTIADHVHYAGNKGPHAGNGRSDAMGGGHAHAGLMVYQGASWPEQYNGKAFMNNIHGARLNMDILEPSGSGFVGHHGADFVNFNDSWSQVLNMLYDQDGSVYIIDWYDKNQCHHNDVNGHDRSNGRIFKLIYNHQKHTPIDLQKLSNSELADLQLVKNDFYVRHARRILQERGKKDDAKQKLLGIINTNPEASRVLRAAWALHSMGVLDEATSLQLLKSPHAYVRGWAIQLAMEDQTPSTGFKKAMLKLAAKDNSPVVRLYVWSAVQRMPLAERWEIVEALLKHKEDAGDHNIPLMAWYGMEPMVSKNPAKALQLNSQTELPRLLNYTVRRLAANSGSGALDLITKSLTTQTEPAKIREMIAGLSAALKGQRKVEMPKGWSKVEEKLSAHPDAEIGAQVQSLSLTFGSKRALESLRKTALDNSADMAGRRTALEALLNVRDDSTAPVLRTLLANAELRGSAIRGLAQFDDAETAPAILAVYKQLNTSEKKDALTTLASRVSNAKPLITAVEQKTVSKGDLSADLIRQLKSLKNDEINNGVQKVWGSFREATADKKAQIAKIRAIYAAGGSTPGDASRGREVFSRTCQQCHTLFDTGGKVGPDLTGSNRADLDYILLNIVDPNAVIPNEYRSSTIDMKDDRVITGIVKQQDDKTLTVITPNELLTLPRNEIKSVQQNELSMMPEGILEALSEREVRDLIYYLSRPGQVGMPAGK